MNINTENRIITAALPFANNIPHLGNIIGSHLPADIFARYCRLRGYRTIFVGGTDEHGTATEFAALKRGTTPKELCDWLYQEHLRVYQYFNISYDNFSRTSREVHHRQVIKFFNRLYSAGLIKEQDLKTPYCSDCKKGLADRYIKGICPFCDSASANGDQCESCGQVLEAGQLKQPHCAFCAGGSIDFRDSKHLFLDLDKVINRVSEWLSANDNLRRQVKNLAGGWISQGLKPRCITRDLEWGIKVPLEGYQDKVFYVWFENVIGYISATVEAYGEEGVKLWQDQNTKVYHFLGKDNIAFHTIYWPGELIGEGSYVLPYNVVGLQYLNFEGEKFSKSRNVGVFADDVLNSSIPIDYWRFYLTWIIPERQDSDFNADDFFQRVNSELVGNFGNLLHRTISLCWQLFDGQVPAVLERDFAFEEQINDKVSGILNAYESCELRSAQAGILKLCDLGNKYLNDKAPWKTKESDPLLYITELVRIAAILFSPIVPDSSKRVLGLLNASSNTLRLDLGEKTLQKAVPLFKKLETEQLDAFRIKAA